ncbi:uncharacterized protein G2W53_001034 [Senna tora]|uniref:Uncharacterized protein n=1 Tax=Senna tora TaxID=362788 RepID=A0A834XGV9_9FABA|nr:uncharacterized protein G2W53_001034 [Senna tora]
MANNPREIRGYNSSDSYEGEDIDEIREN